MKYCGCKLWLNRTLMLTILVVCCSDAVYAFVNTHTDTLTVGGCWLGEENCCTQQQQQHSTQLCLHGTAPWNVSLSVEIVKPFQVSRCSNYKTAAGQSLLCSLIKLTAHDFSLSRQVVFLMSIVAGSSRPILMLASMLRLTDASCSVVDWRAWPLQPLQLLGRILSSLQQLYLYQFFNH